MMPHESCGATHDQSFSLTLCHAREEQGLNRWVRYRDSEQRYTNWEHQIVKQNALDSLLLIFFPLRQQAER